MDQQFSYIEKCGSFEGCIGISQKGYNAAGINRFAQLGRGQSDVAEGIHQPLMLTCITFQTPETDDPLILIAATSAAGKTWEMNGNFEAPFRDIRS